MSGFRWTHDNKLVVDGKVAVILSEGGYVDGLFGLSPHEQGLLFDKRIAELILKGSNHLITKELIVQVLSEPFYMDVKEAEQEFEEAIKEQFTLDFLDSLYLEWVAEGKLFYLNDGEIILISDYDNLTDDELNELDHDILEA